MKMFHHSVRKISVYKNNECKVFANMALLNGLGEAAFFTIFPLILNDTLKSESVVSLYYSLIAIAVFLGSMLSTYLFSKFSKVWIIKITLLVSVLSLLGMTIAKNIWELSGVDIPRAICLTLANLAISIFVFDFSTNSNISRNEARYYIFMNIGWFIGPILGGYIAKFTGKESVFIFVSGIYLISLLYFMHQHIIVKNKNINHKKENISLKIIFNNTIEYFKNKELIKVFLVALGLNFWWAISYLYIPIAVENLGYGTDVVGYVVSGGILPLLLLEGFVGRSADKNGVKKYIIIGFLFLSILTALFPILESSPITLIIAFAVVNIGAAFIEPLKNSYFYKASKKEDEDKFFGIYNLSNPIANMAGPLIGAALIFTGGFNAMWIASAIILLAFAIISTKIKE
jgi:predicted MFS family arabinose efflux permease